MNILVLNGSPRPQGDTAKMVAVFKESAERAGHEVCVINVCRREIKGCLACEYCHGKGRGECIQKDDMQEIYAQLRDTNMLVLASPIYNDYRMAKSQKAFRRAALRHSKTALLFCHILIAMSTGRMIP